MAFCNKHPASCEKYCDWYPDYCEEFCMRMPQFCVPEAIENYYAFLDIVDELRIFSFYGPDWEN